VEGLSVGDGFVFAGLAAEDEEVFTAMAVEDAVSDGGQWPALVVVEGEIEDGVGEVGDVGEAEGGGHGHYVNYRLSIVNGGMVAKWQSGNRWP
jgi:hypothetical protein